MCTHAPQFLWGTQGCFHGEILPCTEHHNPWPMQHKYLANLQHWLPMPRLIACTLRGKQVFQPPPGLGEHKEPPFGPVSALPSYTSRSSAGPQIPVIHLSSLPQKRFYANLQETGIRGGGDEKEGGDLHLGIAFYSQPKLAGTEVTSQWLPDGPCTMSCCSWLRS